MAAERLSVSSKYRVNTQKDLMRRDAEKSEYFRRLSVDNDVLDQSCIDSETVDIIPEQQTDMLRFTPMLKKIWRFEVLRHVPSDACPIRHQVLASGYLHKGLQRLPPHSLPKYVMYFSTELYLCLNRHYYDFPDTCECLGPRQDRSSKSATPIVSESETTDS